MPKLKLARQSFPTGLTLWGPLPGTPDAYLLWAGPGACLKLAIRPLHPNGLLTSIEHPTANGEYQTRAEAERAAYAFADYKEDA